MATSRLAPNRAQLVVVVVVGVVVVVAAVGGTVAAGVAVVGFFRLIDCLLTNCDAATCCFSSLLPVAC